MKHNYTGITTALEAFESFNAQVKDAISNKRSGSVRINVQIGSKRVLGAQIQATLDYRPENPLPKTPEIDPDELITVQNHGSEWMERFESAINSSESGWMRFSVVFKEGCVQSFCQNPSFDYRP